jgi:parallel beta-helix repeat protein
LPQAKIIIVRKLRAGSIKRGSTALAICLMFLLVFLVQFNEVPTAYSWGWTTHRFIETKAELVFSNDPSLSDISNFITTYHSYLYSWCTYPDENKSFMPDGGGEADWHYLDAYSYNPLSYSGGKLPWAMKWIFDNIVQYLKDEDWVTAAQLMGAICHFTGDATMPLHSTWNYNPNGKHSPFESEVNNRMGEISVPDNVMPQYIDNITNAALVVLAESFSFTAEGSGGGVSLTYYLNDNVLWNDWIKNMVENRMRAAVQFTANVWYTAMVQAGMVIGGVAPLSPHGPIYIDGNDNFTFANGVSSGSGTEDDPYIIENWDISAENANGIEIRNTTAHFAIRNCYVHDGMTTYNRGIYLENVTDGKIAMNLLENNYHGVYLYGSNNNLIYHNNFINNTIQARDDGTNYWDDGYPSGGNYWSDYTGVDRCRGENQNMPGSDGIGDAPYQIPGGAGQDSYPLMSRAVPVEISSLRIEPPVVEPSKPVTISVDIKNRGDLETTYWVKLKINGAVESIENVTVGVGEAKSVAFIVTKDPEGNYQVEIDGIEGTFKVEAHVAFPSLNWLLIIGLISFAIAIISIVVALHVGKGTAVGGTIFKTTI